MPRYLVQVLPKGRFGEMISFEFHLEKWHNKTQKPLWFLGFPNRYLFRFAMLVAEVGFERPTRKYSRRRLVRGSASRLLLIFSLVALPFSPTGRGRAPSPLCPFISRPYAAIA